MISGKNSSHTMTFKNVDQNIKTVLPLVLNAQGNEKNSTTKIYLVHYLFIIRNTENLSIYFLVKAYQVVQILLLFFSCETCDTKRMSLPRLGEFSH